MRSDFQCLTGKRFGRWFVICHLGAHRNRRGGVYHRYFCRCDCGTLRSVPAHNLRTGNSISCGCYKQEHTIARQTMKPEDRMDSKPEYRTWRSMKARCHSKGNSAYPKYGARGIAVCERWRESFYAFLEDVGPRPSAGHSIERINNNGHYEPGNCRWATSIEQARNKRTSKMLIYGGETMCMADWSDRLGIPATILYGRLDRGWDVNRAFETPINTRYTRQRRKKVAG